MEEGPGKAPIVEYFNTTAARKRTRIATGDFVLGVLMLLAGTILLGLAAFACAQVSGAKLVFAVAVMGIPGSLGLYIGIDMIRRKEPR